jgi:hypothetical protein
MGDEDDTELIPHVRLTRRDRRLARSRGYAWGWPAYSLVVALVVAFAVWLAVR